MKIKWKLTNRLFVKGEFKDDYGIDCSIQMSSSVEPKIWFGVDKNRMHLNIYQIRDLIPILQQFIDNGYLYWNDNIEKEYDKMIGELKRKH